MTRIALWIAVVWVSGLVTPAAAKLDDALILAVHPYLPVPEIMTRFHPHAEHLAHEIGQPVKVRIGGNHEHHIKMIGKDGVDIAYLRPVSYVKLVARYGKKPLLARQEIAGQPYLRGVIIVRQDSSQRTLADLKGKYFTYGDPDSTMSHVVPERLLQQAGVPRAGRRDLTSRWNSNPVPHS